MKITNERTNKAGKRVLTVELDNDEHLKTFRPDNYYQLGDDYRKDIVYGSTIIDSCRAYWCEIEQKWIA